MMQVLDCSKFRSWKYWLNEELAIGTGEGRCCGSVGNVYCGMSCIYSVVVYTFRRQDLKLHAL